MRKNGYPHLLLYPDILCLNLLFISIIIIVPICVAVCIAENRLAFYRIAILTLHRLIIGKIGIHHVVVKLYDRMRPKMTIEQKCLFVMSWQLGQFVILNQLADKARTGGQYEEIGSLYGFTLLVKTEVSEKETVDIRVNRFLVQGEGNIKYTYNNGLIAKDEKLAAMNFLNALEKLPSYIEQEQKKITEIQKDLPVLQEVVNGTWTKESRLSELKTELAGVERKIQLSITPENNELKETIEVTGEVQERPAARLKP